MQKYLINYVILVNLSLHIFLNSWQQANQQDFTY